MLIKISQVHKIIFYMWKFKNIIERERWGQEGLHNVSFFSTFLLDVQFVGSLATSMN